MRHMFLVCFGLSTILAFGIILDICCKQILRKLCYTMSFPENSSFALSGFGSGFANRQRDLFASLDAVEKEREVNKEQTSASNPNKIQGIHHHEEQMEIDTRPRERRRKIPMKSFRGKESIFKRPEMPAPRRARHSIADHQRNPHKWTKYSLGDVSPQDMSERSNTVTALSFIRELQARKDRSSSADEDEPSRKQMIFKPAKQRNEHHTDSLGQTSVVLPCKASEEGERPSFYRSKMVMPEYVVGQKKTALKKKLKESTQNRTPDKVILDHLVDEDE